MSDPLRKRLLERGHDGKPTFVYVSHSETDVAATWARVRRQQAAEQEAAKAENVRPLKKAAK